MNLNAEYWNKRYLTDDFGWDIGSVSTPLKNYFDQLNNKNLEILIPGAGNAYEAAYLFENGFTRVHILDFAEEPLKQFAAKYPAFPKENLHHEDFFKHRGQYDLIIEQTFFCALNPSLREAYATHMHELLKPGGTLAGLLFDNPMNADHPPFGGNREEYQRYFDPYFTYKHFEACYNSIKPRDSKELFMVLERKP
ncbi:MAG: methyltransferase domain-containing protein [Bacteroidetes bacterium]|nr:methyltransferase domain-containing protein [Bacteroidota bacterium]